MATSTITPPVSAPAAAAPSTPSAPSTPASSTPVSTPAVPSTPSSGSPATTMEERLAANWEKVVASVPVGDEATEKEAAAPPAVEDPAATEEPKAEEAATAEPAESEEKPASTEAPNELEASDSFFDDGEAVGPQALAKELKNDPAAQKFFDERPDLKNKVFGALRRDGETREIRQLIPDIETARLVTTAASTFQNIDGKFLAATTKEGSQAFLAEWAKQALIVDDKGEPALDAQGQYRFHPALTNTFDLVFNNKLDYLAETAKKTGDEELQAALDIIREKTTPDSQALGEVPEEMKPYANSLSAREEAIKAKEEAHHRREREGQEAANQQSVEKAEATASKSVADQLKPLFAKSGLTPFESKAALTTIGELLDAKLEANSIYQSVYDNILTRPPGEAREKALIKHMLSYSNEILGPIATQVIRDAKAGTLKRQTDKEIKVEGQKRDSQTDPRGSSITPVQNKPQSNSDMRAAIVKEYRDSHNGESPDLDYVMAEAWKRMPRPK